jgi:hypothetical protein
VSYATKAAQRAYAAKWYQRNRTRILEQRRAYLAANPATVRARNKASRQRYWKRYRERKLAKTYNISVEVVRKWLRIKRCQSCGETKPLHFDHCHQSGQVRGRLCMNCNSGIGQFYDNPRLLLKAIGYLQRHHVK